MATSNRRVALDTWLWLAQTAVAFTFFFVGSARFGVPAQIEAEHVRWIAAVGEQGPVHVVGIFELIFAFGVLLPAVMQVAPVLTPISAVFLAAFSLAAGVEHVVLGDPWRAIGSGILVVLSLFVAWGRFYAVQIEAHDIEDEGPSESPHPELSEAPQTWVG